MVGERDLDPDRLREDDAAPWFDTRLQPAVLAALRRTEAVVGALASVATSLPERFPRTQAAVASTPSHGS